MVHLLRRWMANSSQSSPKAISSQVECLRQQFRTLSTKRTLTKSTLVQLTKDVPKLGSRGDVVLVKGGRMRNTLYPYSKAQYIRPGNDSFLTQNKLAIPVGPNYRRLLNNSTPDPARIEFAELIKRARRRLLKAEDTKPAPVIRDEILLQIKKYHDLVKKDKQYNKDEKMELLRFLRFQIDSWGMLGDDLQSEKVRMAKQNMLIQTWSKFATAMRISPQQKQNPPKKAKSIVDKGLEQELSTSGTIIQGDVQVLVDGNEVAVGTHEPVGQTVSHKEESSMDTKSTEKGKQI